MPFLSPTVATSTYTSRPGRSFAFTMRQASHLVRIRTQLEMAVAPCEFAVQGKRSVATSLPDVPGLDTSVGGVMWPLLGGKLSEKPS